MKHLVLPAADFQAVINDFLADRGSNKRYSSFDYCYGYFRSHHETGAQANLAIPAQLQNSCNQLAFYLASWGMFRGSSDLLGASSRAFIPLVEWIAQADKRLWAIDIPDYSEKTIPIILDAAKAIDKALPIEKPSRILVTKVLLGVFGCLPALDTYFSRTFGIWTINKKNLLGLKDFYDRNQKIIDGVYPIKCYDFDSGIAKGFPYPISKIIDMYGFSAGQAS